MSGRTVGLTVGALGLVAVLMLAVMQPTAPDPEAEPDTPETPSEDDVGRYIAEALASRPTAPGSKPIAQQRRRDQDAPDPIAILLAPETGVSLGWGWNAFHGEAIPTRCVEFTTARPFEGQTSALDFTEVNDQFELQQAMDMSAEASVKTLAYEAKGEAKFSKTAKVTQSALTYLIEAEVLNAPHMAMPPEAAESRSVTLTPYAERLANRDIDLFKDVCGTGYISGTYGGAKLSVLISITASSRQERETVSAEVEGKGWGAKVNAAMNGDSQTGSSEAKREIHFYQSGGKPQKLPTEPDELIGMAEDLALQADQAERIFRISVTPYEVLQNWPREENLSGSEIEYEELAALWGSFQSMYSDIQAALDDPDKYVMPEQLCEGADCETRFVPVTSGAAQSRLRALQDDVLIWLDRLEIAARDCISAEEMCETNMAHYRTPYAYLTQMPVLASLLTAEEGAPEVPPLALYKTMLIEEPAKGRCALGSLTPGCLSNSAIDAWGARIGQVSIILESRSDIEALRATLPDRPSSTFSGSGPNLRAEGDAPVCYADVFHTADPETELTSSLWGPPACIENLQRTRD